MSCPACARLVLLMHRRTISTLMEVTGPSSRVKVLSLRRSSIFRLSTTRNLQHLARISVTEGVTEGVTYHGIVGHTTECVRMVT